MLSECFDSAEWVVEVTASRPFFMLDQLFVRAEELWQLLSKSDTSLERRIGWTDVEARLAKLLER